VPHRCSFAQISIDAAIRSAVSRAFRYPLLAGCRHDHVFEQRVIFQLYRLSLRLGILGAKTLREVRRGRPGVPLGPAPGRPFAMRHEHQPPSCFAARALRSDVGCQDLSILPRANQMTTLHAP
jgi:hypothetical protein